MRLRDDRKKQAISKAAIHLINEKGLAGISMKKIADQAAVSPATIYIYFQNKEDLINQLYLKAKYDMSQGILRGFRPDMEIETGFRRIWLNHYDYILRHPKQFDFLEQFSNSPLINKMNKEEASSYYQEIYDLFERGKRDGVLKELPTFLIYTYAFMPLVQLVKGELNKTLPFGIRTLDMAYRMAWDAIAMGK